MSRFAPIRQYWARFLLFLEYFLTRGLSFNIAVALYTLACWIWLSEYFWAGEYDWWQGPWEYFFLIPTIGLPFVLAAFGVWRMESHRPLVAPLTFDKPMPVRVWIAMLRETSSQCHATPLPGFLRWQARLLNRYGGPEDCAWPGALAVIWRRNPWYWLRALWLPLLLCFLCSDYSARVMEVAASILENRVPDIQGAIASRPSGLPSSALRPQDGELYLDDFPRYPGGRLAFSVSDFPRVYRKLQAICGGARPHCTVSLPVNGQAEVPSVAPVRAGSAVFHFDRQAGEESLELSLTLFRQDGTTVFAKTTVH